PALPRAKPPLLGVLNLRRIITPVYDPSLRLGLPSTVPVCAGPDSERPPRPARILVVRTALGPAGLWVDRVRGVQRLRPNALERPPGGPTGGGMGVLRTTEGPCTVVDPEWLLRGAGAGGRRARSAPSGSATRATASTRR